MAIGPKNLIIRMPNWLGDVVMATPLIKDVRAQFPECRITVMALDKVAPLLEDDPNIDELFVFSRPSGWLHRQGDRDVVQQLRQGNYDVGLLATNSFSSAWWMWRAGIAKRIGFDMHWRRWLLTQPLSLPSSVEAQHLVLTYKDLLRPLGIPVSRTAPKLYVSDEDLAAARALCAKHGVRRDHILVGINPAAAFGTAKCWLPSRFRHVTQKLLANPLVRVVYFGDAQGRKLVQEICTGLPDRVINIAGETSLRQMMALIQHCDIFLTNDSGPMHVAAALGTPLLALFGSTSDVRTGPYEFGRVIHKHVECSPCYKRECPIDFRCMTRIGVEEVYKELQDLINQNATKV